MIITGSAQFRTKNGGYMRYSTYYPDNDEETVADDIFNPTYNASHTTGYDKSVAPILDDDYENKKADRLAEKERAKKLAKSARYSTIYRKIKKRELCEKLTFSATIVTENSAISQKEREEDRKRIIRGILSSKKAAHLSESAIAHLPLGALKLMLSACY